MKKLLIMMMAAMLATFAFAGCGEEKSDSGAAQDGGKVFTSSELAEFDGRDGRPAYVAVDGVVYDITGSPLWPEGDHGPCGLDAMAGRDLGEEIGESPHGQAIFSENSIPVVGRLED